MKLLIDENLTPKLATSLAPITALGIRALGWADESNGSLLRLMHAEGFTILLTSDSKLKYQQNLEKHRISIIVLEIFKGTRKDQLACVPEIREACLGIKPGEVRVVLGPHPKRHP